MRKFLADLCIEDHIVIGFFTAVVLGLTGAVIQLYKDKRK